MCYDDQARPPLPPGSATPAQGQDIILKSSDGNQFAAYAATPAQPPTTQVLIYPDVRGLHQFYKELALRFAEVGISALALDYFGRTAGLTSRDDTFEYMPHVQQMQYDSFALDVQAGLDYLRQRLAVPIFVVGFCRGGTLAFLTGTNPAFGFAGLIPFYAGLTRDVPGKGSVLDNARQVAYPVMGFFGGADTGIPESNIIQLREQLTESGVDHNLIVYPGAPHSFFDRRATEFAEASTDAWQHLLDFIAARNPVA